MTVGVLLDRPLARVGFRHATGRRFPLPVPVTFVPQEIAEEDVPQFGRAHRRVASDRWVGYANPQTRRTTPKWKCLYATFTLRTTAVCHSGNRVSTAEVSDGPRRMVIATCSPRVSRQRAGSNVDGIATWR